MGDVCMHSFETGQPQPCSAAQGCVGREQFDTGFGDCT
eukprot:gene33703-43370_t